VEPAAASDVEAKHYEAIGLTAEGCRKAFEPYEVKADEETRRVSFVITTGAVDRDNDTIKVDGWDFKNWLKNPVVLWGHNSSIPPIAKGVSLVKRGGAIHATAQFPPEGVYELADTVFGLIKHLGTPGATSVGFRPKMDKDGRPRLAWNEERGGVDFEEQELLEFSIVTVPSNPEALMTMAKDFATAAGKGVDLAPIRKALDLAEQATGKAPDEAVQMPAQVRITGGEMALEKAGRRLSTKTEASLRSAHKAASDAVGHLQEALGDAEDEMDDKAAAPVLMVTPSPVKTFLVNPDDVKAAVVAAVAEQVKGAINRACGRLD
jgi:hypothetical protein